MANPVLGNSLCSDWFFSRSGFCSTDRFHGNGPIRVFLFWSKAGKFNICNQDSEKKCENGHSSHWNYQQKLKRLKFFWNFKDGWRRRTFFKCKPPEVHFTIRNRVPYNKLLTNRACSGLTGEYWPLVVFLRTERSEVHTVTTRSVSKRLLLYGKPSPSHQKCILLSRTECHIINYLLTELARAVLGNTGPWSFLSLSRPRANIPQYGPRARLVRGYYSLKSRWILAEYLLMSCKAER